MELSFENFNNVAGGAGPNAVDPREIFKRNLEKVVKDKKGGDTKDKTNTTGTPTSTPTSNPGNNFTNNNQGGKQNSSKQGNKNENSSENNSIK